MKKLLAILVLGLLWCNVGFAEKLVLACKVEVFQNNAGIESVDEDFTQVLDLDKKYWLFNNEKRKLIIDDRYFVVYEVDDEYIDLNSASIMYRRIDRYDGSFYEVSANIPVKEFKIFQKIKKQSYNMKNYKKLEQASNKYTRGDYNYSIASGVCKKDKKKF